jgi:hypothetical protein
MSLRFTASGAVPVPDTLQLRVSPVFRARLGAGAPTPSRALTDDELVANVVHFAAVGPRGKPADRVVLSGVPEEWVASMVALVPKLRASGAAVITAHAEPATVAAWVGVADQVAVTVRDVESLAALPPGLVLTVPLEEAVLPKLGALLGQVRDRAPRQVVVAWPYPDGGPPPPPVVDVVEALVDVRALLSVLPFSVKGVPACLLSPLRRVVPDLAERATRTRNRWYVDADHQLGEALLFVPDVLRFAKSDACRFCELDARCDGVALGWHRLGLTGPLLPIHGA